MKIFGQFLILSVASNLFRILKIYLNCQTLQYLLRFNDDNHIYV